MNAAWFFAEVKGSTVATIGFSEMDVSVSMGMGGLAKMFIGSCWACVLRVGSVSITNGLGLGFLDVSELASSGKFPIPVFPHIAFKSTSVDDIREASIEVPLASGVSGAEV